MSIKKSMLKNFAKVFVLMCKFLCKYNCIPCFFSWVLVGTDFFVKMVRSSITYSEDECTGGQSTRLSVCSEPITIKKNYLCTEVHPAQTHRWHSEPANIRPRPYTNSTKKVNSINFLLYVFTII